MRICQHYDSRSIEHLSAPASVQHNAGRQCRATFQFDRIGAKLVDDIGVETLMWGSDYPHPDGVWPESSKYIEEQFAGLPADVVHKITCENAGKFYGLIN